MGVVKDLTVAARRWAAARGTPSALAASSAEREELRRWYALLSGELPGTELRGSGIFEIEAKDLPWIDTGIDLEQGESVSTFAAGRVVLSDPLDIWVGPQFQLWMRVGEGGTIFNGTRETHSFRTASAGRLYLAGYFPGQWGDLQGRVSTPLAEYANFRGGLTVAVLRWSGDAASSLEAFAPADAGGRLEMEAARLREQVQPPPGWNYLWFLGRSEIFREATHEGRPCIACHTERNASILQRDVALDLAAGTRIAWKWNVHELPSPLREDTQASHDYLSVAIEFENGRDITYTWSRELPAGTGYWCPLPTWKDREFHVVVRSGSQGLGEWLAEERDLHGDYRHYIGEPPRRVVRVWLIAVSIFQRKRGIAEFADIRLVRPDGSEVPVG
jgi:hypothetical protein